MRLSTCNYLITLWLFFPSFCLGEHNPGTQTSSPQGTTPPNQQQSSEAGSTNSVQEKKETPEDLAIIKITELNEENPTNKNKIEEQTLRDSLNDLTSADPTQVKDAKALINRLPLNQLKEIQKIYKTSDQNKYGAQTKLLNSAIQAREKVIREMFRFEAAGMVKNGTGPNASTVNLTNIVRAINSLEPNGSAQVNISDVLETMISSNGISKSGASEHVEVNPPVGFGVWIGTETGSPQTISRGGGRFMVTVGKPNAATGAPDPNLVFTFTAGGENGGRNDVEMIGGSPDVTTPEPTGGNGIAGKVLFPLSEPLTLDQLLKNTVEEGTPVLDKDGVLRSSCVNCHKVPDPIKSIEFKLSDAVPGAPRTRLLEPVRQKSFNTELNNLSDLGRQKSKTVINRMLDSNPSSEDRRRLQAVLQLF